MSDQEKNDKQSNPSPEDTSQAKSDTHPMCENAPDKEKCETFVERLEEASNNIDSKDN